MRVLFIQQDHVSPVGPIGDGFARRGFDLDLLPIVPSDRFHTPDVSVVFPDPLAYDAIVPMGAPWSVYDHGAIGSWVRNELDFLRAAHDAGVPVLGICFGGQALAAALGGSVELSPAPEIGWVSVDAADGLIEPGPWFQFHYDRWTLPPGARELARTANASQAFVLGRSLGVQFHPELTADALRGWIENGAAAVLRNHGIDPDGLLARTTAEEGAAAERAMRLVDRFLELR
jgi:GMP synthase-like glutamine amidotransferase